MSDIGGLNSERLVEVALGSCIATGLNTEVFLATAGVVLSWAHGLPVPIDTLLATYGTDVVAALAEAAAPSNCSPDSIHPVARSGPSQCATRYLFSKESTYSSVTASSSLLSRSSISLGGVPRLPASRSLSTHNWAKATMSSQKPSSRSSPA